MQEDELVLSDVHLGRCSDSNDKPISYEYSAGEMQLTVTTSIFTFHWPSTTQELATCDPPVETTVEHDEDGDIIVTRRSNPGSFSLIIEHSMASPLPLVGLQVWAGALLMCDYMLHIRQRINDKTVLELGAGTGICSIVAAMFAKKVISTDYDHRVLRLCRRNISRNDRLIQRSSSLFWPHQQSRSEPSVEVKELNWELFDPFGSCGKTEESDEWRSWTEEDRKGIEIILATDVIYENKLTDHLFKLLEKLFEELPKKTVFISLERRLNFTLEKLAISCPAHDHFLRHLDEPRFGVGKAKKIPIDFPQHFDYERNKYLELWEISS